ncbi:MAG: hypothetical protein KC496_02450, partial [Anaerolineae bacterium]|nr:hypothetical protein [Anaerolineae bacterium]
TRVLQLFAPFALVVALFNTLAVAANTNLWFSFLANIPGIALVPLCWWLAKRQYYRLIVIVPPLLMIPILYIQALHAGPPFLYLIMLSFFPFYGGVLLYVRWNYLLALMSIASLILFYVLFPRLLTIQALLQWISVFFTINILLLFFTAYMTRMETSRQRSERNQERLSAMRDFIRNVSHDFRTPLTVIQSSAYLLLRVDDPEKRKKQAAQIDRMVERMEQMLNNTVLLAKLQSTTRISRTEVSLTEVLEVLRAEFMKLAEQHQIELSIDIQPHLPILQGDAELILVSLRHVLENALRYTDHGGQVWVSAQTTGKGVSITIADTGMGIAAEQLKQIFEPMYRTDSARAMDTGGTGVGLAIAQLIVELHGGRIHVTSEVGVGSQFTLEFPVPHALQHRSWLGFLGGK